jgi:hypothetical protein
VSDETADNFIADFRASLGALEEGLQGFLRDNSEPETLAEVLSDLHLLKTHVGLLYDELAAATADAFGTEAECTLSDGTVIEKKWSSTRRGWQHKDLAHAVATRIAEQAVDLDTGEVVMTPAQIAEHMLDYVQPSYWKVKPVSTLGLDVDNYCEVGETKTSMIVRRAK